MSYEPSAVDQWVEDYNNNPIRNRQPTRQLFAITEPLGDGTYRVIIGFPQHSRESVNMAQAIEEQCADWKDWSEPKAGGSILPVEEGHPLARDGICGGPTHIFLEGHHQVIEFKLDDADQLAALANRLQHIQPEAARTP